MPIFTNSEIYDKKITYAEQALKPRLIFASIAIGTVLTLAALTPVSFPFVISGILNATLIGTSTYLYGLLYGVGNDMLACRNNIKYFTEGHQEGQDLGLVKTDDPNTNAVAWGIAATHELSLAAGIIFGLAAGISFACGAPFAPFMLALLPLGTFALGLSAHFFAKNYEKTLLQSPNQDQDTVSYDGNGARNLFGYIALPLFALALLAGTAALSASHIAIPLFLLSIKWEVVTAVLPAVLLTGGLSYFYHQTNKLKEQPELQSDQFKEVYG